MATLLPCHAHRNCTYHQHWTTRMNNVNGTLAANTAGNISSVEHETPKNRTPSGTLPHDTRSQPAALFPNIPNELLLAISAHLSPIERASLALTCRRFASAIGPPAWKLLSKAGIASWATHERMLDVLQRDLSSDNFWRCEACLRFHSRRKSMPVDDTGYFQRLHHTSQGVTRFLRGWGNDYVQLGPSTIPIYVLHFASAQAVMDRHFNNTNQGVCLDALRCSGELTLPNSETSEMHLRYDIAPRIIVDRLVIQSTYMFTLKPTMVVRNVKVNEASASEFITALDFWTCGHRQTGDILSRAERVSKNSGACKQQRCSHCPTQSTVYLFAQNIIRIRTWQNIGSVRSIKELNWVHLSRTGKWKKKHKWGKEDLQEAYQRIWCSTKEEFMNQVERSDGRGQWYEPELKTRVYKTLPLTIVERI